MADATNDLMKLRPVVFTYKADTTGKTQYGLIAEEVEEVYPELVAHSSDGKVETVYYRFLSSMLLNEWQKRNKTIVKQQKTIVKLEKEMLEKDTMIQKIDERLKTLEMTLQ